MDNYTESFYPKIPNVYTRQEGNSNQLNEGTFSSPELQYLSELPWLWTEKVDGTNTRISWDGHRVSFGGRTSRAQMPAHLANKLVELFSGNDKEELFEQKFGETPVTLFGEGFGEKIQSGGKYGPVDFILFDVLVAGKYWLNRTSVEDVASVFGIRVVPIVGIGTLKEGVEYIKGHPKSELKDDVMEGIVCRPAVELFDKNRNRLIVKIKCRDFKEEKANG